MVIGPVGPAMACEICGTRLNNFERWEGNRLKSITWEHTGLFPEGTEPHDPAPVLLDPNVMPEAGFCDFCNSDNPAWCYPCDAFKITVAARQTNEGSDTLGWGSADNWAACQECKDDIEAGKWDSIHKRYLSHKDAPKMYRSTTRHQLRALHREFRLHRLGPPFRVKPKE